MGAKQSDMKKRLRRNSVKADQLLTAAEGIEVNSGVRNVDRLTEKEKKKQIEQFDPDIQVNQEMSDKQLFHAIETIGGNDIRGLTERIHGEMNVQRQRMKRRASNQGEKQADADRQRRITVNDQSFVYSCIEDGKRSVFLSKIFFQYL